MLDAHPFLQDFIAGNVGGMLGTLLVFPLDTAKTRLQTFPDRYPDGMRGVFREMLSPRGGGGVHALYRGLPSPLAGMGILYAMSFAANGQAQRALEQWGGFRRNPETGEMSVAHMTLAGAYAGLVQAPVRSAIERVKVAMQAREGAGGKGSSPYRWSGACAVALVREEGLAGGLFRGMTATLAREIPQFAVYYPSYELCKRYIARLSDTPKSELKAHHLLICGGIAGTVQWLPPIFSVDVIKSRMQSARPGVYSGFIDCIRKSYQAEGMYVFFRGLAPALVRAFPLHACIFLGYEVTMAGLKR